MVFSFIVSVFHGAVLRLRARNKPTLKQYQSSTLALKYPLTAVAVIGSILKRARQLTRYKVSVCVDFLNIRFKRI